MIGIIEYTIKIDDNSTDKVAVYNDDKISYQTACACVSTDTYNPYLITMDKEHFENVFEYLLKEDEEGEKDIED